MYCTDDGLAPRPPYATVSLSNLDYFLQSDEFSFIYIMRGIEPYISTMPGHWKSVLVFADTPIPQAAIAAHPEDMALCIRHASTIIKVDLSEKLAH